MWEWLACVEKGEENERKEIKYVKELVLEKKREVRL